MKCPSTVIILCFFLASCGDTSTGDVVLASPILYGLGFSPYKNGQSPPDSVPLVQISERLSIVAPYANWIRTWGMASGLEKIPEAARGYGLNVAACAYVNGDATNDELQKSNLIASAIAGHVDVAIVGNEMLVNGGLTENQLIAHLQDVRQRLDAAGLSSIPVTTAEPYGVWANAQPGGLFHRDGSGQLVHAAVLQNIDILFAHLYPFHEGTHIDNAVQKLADMYGEVEAAVGEVVSDLEVVIGETGWPSDGNSNIQAIPSLANEERYFGGVTTWSETDDIQLFWFSAFDENWKPDGYAGVEKHWGLHYANGTAKFPIPEPTSLCCLGLGACSLLGIRRRRH